MTTIAVLGAGSWGTTLADLLARKGEDVRLWAYEPEVVEAVNWEHQNPAFLAVVSRLFTPDRGLVVGCSNGNRSARACQMLSQMGYGRLILVSGGYSGAHDASGNVVAAGWSADGLPVAGGRDEGAYDAVFARIKGRSSST